MVDKVWVGRNAPPALHEVRCSTVGSQSELVVVSDDLSKYSGRSPSLCDSLRRTGYQPQYTLDRIRGGGLT